MNRSKKNARNRLPEYLLVGCISLLATYGFFSDYLPPFKRVHLWSDIEGYHFPLQQYAFQALKSGHIPQWDPSIYCGISFVGNLQAALLYPPTWLMFAASWNRPMLSFKALEDFTLMHVWLGFVLCYMWLRGRARPFGCALAAAVFAYTGYMVYEVLHPGVVSAMAWYPLGFSGIDEAAERRDWRPLWKVSVASAMSFLAGYPACWIVYAIISVIYSLGTFDQWRTFAGTCVAVAASPLLFLPQLLPAMEARSMMVLEPKYGEGAYDLFTLLRSYFLPNWFDFNPGHPTTFVPGCLYLYLGLPALFAIAWAVRRHRARPYFQPMLALAAALLLANPSLVLIQLVQRIPALNYTMQPYNFYAAVALMAALITAISLEDFFQPNAAKGSSPSKWAMAVVLSALLVGSLRQLWISGHGGVFGTRGKSMTETAVALAIFAIGLYSVRWATGRTRVLLSGVVLLTAGVDYRVFGAARWFNAVPGDLDRRQPSYGIGGIDDEAYRAMKSNRQYRVISVEANGPRSNDYRMYGLATPEGFDPFLPAQYKQTIENWVQFRTNRVFQSNLQDEAMLQMLGIRFVSVINTLPDDRILHESANFRLLGRRNIFAHVYEYLHAKAPFRWEDENADGTVEPTEWQPETREFRVSSARGGRFLFIEQFFPGWKATVDGIAVQIERWGGAFQSVQVPPGDHHLRFEYRSRGLAVGTKITLGLAGVLLLLWSGLCLRHRRGFR